MKRYTHFLWGGVIGLLFFFGPSVVTGNFGIIGLEYLPKFIKDDLGLIGVTYVVLGAILYSGFLVIFKKINIKSILPLVGLFSLGLVISYILVIFMFIQALQNWQLVL